MTQKLRYSEKMGIVDKILFKMLYSFEIVILKEREVKVSEQKKSEERKFCSFFIIVMLIGCMFLAGIAYLLETLVPAEIIGKGIVYILFPCLALLILWTWAKAIYKAG